MPTKRYFTIYFISTFALISLIAYFLYTIDVKTDMILHESEETHKVALHKQLVESSVSSIISDLLFLAEQNELQTFIEKRSGKPLEEAKMEYLAFSRHKQFYDQIRYIDEKGLEVIRINFKNGNPEIVSPEKTQNKSHRYYFMETMAKNKGDIYVSPFDLNIENGQIERPLKPMIRFGTPVFNSSGTKAGIVILNYLGKHLLNGLRDVANITGGDMMLLNQHSYWLMSENRDEEWGFMFSDKKDLTFSKKFPKAWEIISKNDSGQFRNENGLFTFIECRPIEKGVLVNEKGKSSPDSLMVNRSNYSWKSVSFFSSDQIYSKARREVDKFWLFYFVSTVLALIGSWILAVANARKRNAEESLATSEKRFRNLSSSAKDAIILSNGDGEISYCNLAAEQMFGYDRNEFIGKNLGLTILAPNEKSLLESILNRTPDENGTEQIRPAAELTASKKDGKKLPVELSYSTFIIDHTLWSTAIIRDVSERKEMQAKLESMALTDSLTNLPNRMMFVQRLEHDISLAKRNKSILALLFVDLDGFKKINDTFGHEVGDFLLQEISKRLTLCVRESDTIARLGGDEFTIILPVVDNNNGATLIAERIINSLKTPFLIQEETCQVGASIGIALFPQNGDNATALIKQADGAMYAAKNDGRNRHHFAL